MANAVAVVAFAASVSAIGCSMDCKKPYTTGSNAFACGQCMPCRIRKKRIWQARLALERMVHSETAFVTLTYDDENLPKDGSVSPREMQLWLKRLRKEMGSRKLRYFVVGEYGDTTQRPHYHALLFGMPGCVRGVSRLRYRGDTPCGCYACSTIRRTWTFGYSSIGEVSIQSAGYVAGYTIKKLTKSGDPRLGGRHPEFARMSLKPAIGVPALAAISEALVRSKHKMVDVPAFWRQDGKLLPFGRTLRRNLRKILGRDETCPPEALIELQQELWNLYVDSRSSEKSFAKLIVEASQGNISLAETRQQIWKKKESL